MDLTNLTLWALDLTLKGVSKVYRYKQEFKLALAEIEQLNSELIALAGILEIMKSQVCKTVTTTSETIGRGPESQTLSSLRPVLEGACTFLQNLQKQLEIPKSPKGSFQRRATWPWTAEDSRRQIMYLERVKSLFILTLTTHDISLSQQLCVEVHALRRDLEEKGKKEEEGHKNSLHQRIRNWLSPVDPATRKAAALEVRLPGTGQWLLKRERFKTWARATGASWFWLNGIAGSGKTMITTAVIDYLLQRVSPTTGVAYFYCDFHNHDTQAPHVILGSILKQLCGSAGLAMLEPVFIEKLGNGFKQPEGPSTEKLVHYIAAQLKRFEHTYILVDGLNECHDQLAVLESLKLLILPTHDLNVHLFFSSVRLESIQHSLEDIPGVFDFDLRPRDVQPDVDQYIWSRLENEPRLKGLKPDLKSQIFETLSLEADGMFLLVHCQLNTLRKLRTGKAIRATLAALPGNLNQTYERMLNRIDEEDMEYAKEALQLLAFSVRPMVLNELTDGVAVEIGSSHYDEESQLPPYSLLEILGPLVRFNADLEEVTLAHRTLKTYLTSDTILQTSAKYFHLLESSANDAIAKKCLTYLSFDDFAGGPCEVSDIGQRLLRYPFLRYATYHWKAHITELTDPLWKLLGPFLLSGQMNRRNFQAWVQLLIPDSTADFIAQTHPLYYAASFGLTPVVQYLLERGANTESRGGRYNSTALSVATYRGHVDIVRLLLCHGADPDSRDSEGYSVLHWAVACEQPEIKLLLEAYMCF